MDLNPFMSARTCQVATCRCTEQGHLNDLKALKFESKANKMQAASRRPVITMSITLTTFYYLYGINSSPPSVTYMRRWTGSALVQIMACRLVGTKPLSEPMLEYC